MSKWNTPVGQSELFLPAIRLDDLVVAIHLIRFSIVVMIVNNNNTHQNIVSNFESTAHNI